MLKQVFAAIVLASSVATAPAPACAQSTTEAQSGVARVGDRVRVYVRTGVASHEIGSGRKEHKGMLSGYDSLFIMIQPAGVAAVDTIARSGITGIYTTDGTLHSVAGRTAARGGLVGMVLGLFGGLASGIPAYAVIGSIALGGYGVMIGAVAGMLSGRVEQWVKVALPPWP